MNHKNGSKNSPRPESKITSSRQSRSRYALKDREAQPIENMKDAEISLLEMIESTTDHNVEILNTQFAVLETVTKSSLKGVLIDFNFVLSQF